MNLELLLNEISYVTKRYDEIYKVSGEKFNIFNILNVTSDEISHSNFIASLLDPFGSHGKGNIFVKLFLNEIGIDNFSIENIKVETEKFIGHIDIGYEGGGRIDIVITDQNEGKQIFIENKIYAVDQKKQLYRYHNFNPEASLIYLTLYGENASKDSLSNLEPKKDYAIISYKGTILRWLELCKRESIDLPLLRETIAQYIFLIKQLTNQLRSKQMEEDLLKILMKSEENISATFDIVDSFNILKEYIIEKKFKVSIDEVGERKKLRIQYTGHDTSGIYWGFEFRKNEWKHVKIRFEFQSSNFKNLIYGICGKEMPEELNSYLRSCQYKASPVWALYKYMESYQSWGKDEFLKLYNENNDIIIFIEKKIDELLEIIKGRTDL
jgi:hypothetical protein